MSQNERVADFLAQSLHNRSARWSSRELLNIIAGIYRHKGERYIFQFRSSAHTRRHATDRYTTHPQLIIAPDQTSYGASCVPGSPATDSTVPGARGADIQFAHSPRECHRARGSYNVVMMCANGTGHTTKQRAYDGPTSRRRGICEYACGCVSSAICARKQRRLRRPRLSSLVGWSACARAA